MSKKNIKNSDKSKPNSESQKGRSIKGQLNEKLYNERPIKEGYQPTDRLDTSNPPSGEDNKGKE
ncbi:MAG: hypothetical protein ACOC2M_03120 [bacterium]